MLKIINKIKTFFFILYFLLSIVSCNIKTPVGEYKRINNSNEKLILFSDGTYVFINIENKDTICYNQNKWKKHYYKGSTYIYLFNWVDSTYDCKAVDYDISFFNDELIFSPDIDERDFYKVNP